MILRDLSLVCEIQNECQYKNKRFDCFIGMGFAIIKDHAKNYNTLLRDLWPGMLFAMPGFSPP